MKIGIHSMVWVGDWNADAAREAISKSAETGYDLIELSAIAPETFDTDLTAKLLGEYGLECSASLGLGPDTDISSEDPDAVARGRERLHLALNLVRDCGGSMLCGVIYGALMKYSHPATERGLENSRTVLAELADKAKESNIRLGLEFCNRYETNVINTTAQTLEFIDSIGRDNITAHLDTYHMNIEENSMAGAIKQAAAAGKLGYVHVGESHRGQLGTGSINWPEFLGALKEVDYDGIVTFESFSSKVVHSTFSNDLAIWRNLWDDNVELAKGARQFIREHLGV
ncbi:sugar phosphate isomerase/epimerase [Tessaracoccus sp. MC1865]|uniref:sugar phosphate isomerase/epimerase family protein n=1 Tax=Tessaracoccus sp. MC1865 TaxID=2760310 RepID=UPI0016000DBF|nr:sugar phosphate isomerase/epimerase family protein [Tessaracoccus sp. MC1865]MBB1484150.1 sugar phosphate isomerase/epimerase [Tessaracoccus sp. MC1865]QTO37176.1 sugar phosphate isomerase/epimerase [Tessaracoccus sp. MC1865]